MDLQEEGAPRPSPFPIPNRGSGAAPFVAYSRLSSTRHQPLSDMPAPFLSNARRIAVALILLGAAAVYLLLY